MKAAILCGGKATRLGALTETTPKSLIEIKGVPFIFWQLNLLHKAGLKRVLLCCGHLGHMIRDCVGSSYRGMAIEYTFDGDRPLGTAGALRQALPLLGNAFFVLYGDSYLDCGYGEVAHAFFLENKPVMLAVVKNDNPRYKNNVRLNGSAVYYSKEYPVKNSGHIDYGLSVMSPSAVLSSGFNDLADVYEDWSIRNRLGVYEMDKPFHEIGSLEGLIETRKCLEG